MKHSDWPAATALFFIWLVPLACSSVSSSTTSDDKPGADNGATPSAKYADIEAVSASGQPGSYTFSVTIRSPDSGCEQYANWWEVIAPDGRLVYRRILGHSHVDEQPFTRTGGPAEVGADDEVVVRAHMHPGGYGGVAMRGTVAAGFKVDSKGASIAPELAQAQPLPERCAF